MCETWICSIDPSNCSESVNGLFVVCSQLHCWTPEEACEKLASVRPHILVRSAQLEMLRTYHRQVCGQSSWARTPQQHDTAVFTPYYDFYPVKTKPNHSPVFKWHFHFTEKLRYSSCSCPAACDWKTFMCYVSWNGNLSERPLLYFLSSSKIWQKHGVSAVELFFLFVTVIIKTVQEVIMQNNNQWMTA